MLVLVYQWDEDDAKHAEKVAKLNVADEEYRIANYTDWLLSKPKINIYRNYFRRPKKNKNKIYPIKGKFQVVF